jgi:hypothetical protein
MAASSGGAGSSAEFLRRSRALAIVVQMHASDPIQPNNRKRRDIATERQVDKRRVADEWTLVEFRP